MNYFIYFTSRTTLLTLGNDYFRIPHNTFCSSPPLPVFLSCSLFLELKEHLIISNSTVKLHFAPCKYRIRFPESGKICLWNPESHGLWNRQYSSRNPESYLQLESSNEVPLPKAGIHAVPDEAGLLTRA